MDTRILIVEDHAAVRRSLRQWLEVSFPSCRVVEAVSGEEAVTIAKAVSPHVVVMDIGLPGMNGIDATRRLKAVLPAAQVVMLTFHEDDDYRADASAVGASAFVPKRTMETDFIPTLTALLLARAETCQN